MQFSPVLLLLMLVNQLLCFEASLATLLHGAVSADDVDSLKSLLEQGYDINAIGEGGQTPLMRACLSGKVKALAHQLNAGADLTIGEMDGYTCSHGIAYQGRAEAVSALSDLGLDIWMQKHADGYYPIHRACWGDKNGHTATVRKLLQIGVPYDLAADNGSTPLDNVRSNEATRKLLQAWSEKRKEEKPTVSKDEV